MGGPEGVTSAAVLTWLHIARAANRSSIHRQLSRRRKHPVVPLSRRFRPLMQYDYV